jgi:apolipoprotein N-acyltransferase
MAVFRAVENHVPLVQAGNTGITAVIDADGRLRTSLPVFETNVLVERIRFADIESFYTHYGDVFAYVTLLISVLLLAWGLHASRGVNTRPARNNKGK